MFGKIMCYLNMVDDGGCVGVNLVLDRWGGYWKKKMLASNHIWVRHATAYTQK